MTPGIAALGVDVAGIVAGGIVVLGIAGGIAGEGSQALCGTVCPESVSVGGMCCGASAVPGNATPGIVTSGIAALGVDVAGIVAGGIVVLGIAGGIAGEGCQALCGTVCPESIIVGGMCCGASAAPGNATPGIVTPGIAALGVDVAGIVAGGIVVLGIAGGIAGVCSQAPCGTVCPESVIVGGMCCEASAAPGNATPGIGISALGVAVASIAVGGIVVLPIAGASTACPESVILGGICIGASAANIARKKSHRETHLESSTKGVACRAR